MSPLSDWESGQPRIYGNVHCVSLTGQYKWRVFPCRFNLYASVRSSYKRPWVISSPEEYSGK